MLNGRAREMGLGSVLTIPLEDGRKRAAACRAQLTDGKDPIELRKEAERAHRAGWKNSKYAELWTNTLKTYSSPVFGALPVQNIDTALVLKVIESLWPTKTETGCVANEKGQPSLPQLQLPDGNRLTLPHFPFFQPSVSFELRFVISNQIGGPPRWYGARSSTR